MRNLDIKSIKEIINMHRHDYKCRFATQCGRSMIEMLGVLAIIGVLSVGGIAGYSKAMMKYRINKTIEQITLIAGNVRAFFAPQGNYAGLDDKKVIKKAKLVPDEMWDGDYNYIKDVWGDGVALAAADKISEGDEKAFRIGLFIHNEEVCIELLTQDWTSLSLASIIYAYNIKTNGEEPEYYLLPPIAIDDAINVCSDLDQVTISFLFDIQQSSTYWQKELNRCSLPDGC